MSYSKGISWIKDCRITFENTQNPATNPKYRLEASYKMPEKGSISKGSITQFRSSLNEIDVTGRFTPNLLVCDDMLNDGRITKTGFNPNAKTKQYRGGNFGGGKTNDNGIDYGDKGTNSRYYDLDIWFDKMIEKL